jgi:hypothetical protein
MYVAPGLLDQRLTFYQRQEAGADGFVRPVYVQTGVYWGRLDIVADQQNVGTAPQAHIDSRFNVVATVASYVAVDPFGIVKVEDDESLYHVRGVYPVRQTRAQQITLEKLLPEESAAFVGYEPAEVLDGYHYGKAIDGFSTGFDTGFA